MWQKIFYGLKFFLGEKNSAFIEADQFRIRKNDALAIDLVAHLVISIYPKHRI